MPPHADVMQRLREAIVAIVGALPAVQTVTGRATDNCVSWSAIGEAPRPTVAYTIPVLAQVGEDRDARDGVIQFTAVAEGNDADRKVQELLDAIEDGFTASALFAQGIDGAPMRLTRRMQDDEAVEEAYGPRDITRNLYVAHLDVDITLTQ